MTRTPLAERTLPNYTHGQEIANATTHIIGAVIGVIILLLAIFTAIDHNDPWALVSGIVYGASMILLYTVSSVYHALPPGYAKKVMQVIDHCTIYFLIAGCYTPILLTSMRPLYPKTAWIVFAAEWGLAAFATVFTAIDHHRYAKASMICYIGMGWLVVFAIRPTLETVGVAGCLWLLAGGIAYTVGAALYGVGKKKPIMHTVFHLCVNAGSILQAVCILKYVL